MSFAVNAIMIIMKRMTPVGISIFWSVVLLFLLPGCAGRNVQDISLVDSSASPEMVRGDYPAHQDRTVQWGGMIIGVLTDQSPVLLDILSYPLDSYGNPQESYTATGRFFVELPSALDQSSYRVGRFVTVVGSIEREMLVQAGVAGYRFPVLGQAGIYLWDSYRRERQQVRPVFSFGLGVRL